MFNAIRQICLAIGAFSLILISVDGLKDYPHEQRVMMVCVWGAILIIGLVMTAWGHANKRVKPQEIRPGFYDGQLIQHAVMPVIQLVWTGKWMPYGVNEMHIVDCVMASTEIRVPNWKEAEVAMLPLPRIELHISVGSTGRVSFDPSLKWLSGYVPELLPNTMSVIFFWPHIDGSTLASPQAINFR